MKVDELIKLAKGKKDYDFSQRIKLRYMPYAEKCVLVKNAVEVTSYITVNGKKLYKRNTAGMLFYFTMKMIENYTDLEYEKDNVVIVYDALMESGLMEKLMQEIPESEIKILRGMLDMERDDIEANTRTLVSYIETKSDAFEMAVDKLTEALMSPEIQAKIAKKD